MRNLHFTSPSANVISYPCGMGKINRDVWVGWLNKAMGNRSNAASQTLTPSEAQVISDFHLWADSVETKEWTNLIVNAAFTYFNCNTGDHVVFVAWCGHEDYAVRTWFC